MAISSNACNRDWWSQLCALQSSVLVMLLSWWSIDNVCVDLTLEQRVLTQKGRIREIEPNHRSSIRLTAWRVSYPLGLLVKRTVHSDKRPTTVLHGFHWAVQATIAPYCHNFDVPCTKTWRNQITLDDVWRWNNLGCAGKCAALLKCNFILFSFASVDCEYFTAYSQDRWGFNLWIQPVPSLTERNLDTINTEVSFQFSLCIRCLLPNFPLRDNLHPSEQFWMFRNSLDQCKFWKSCSQMGCSLSSFWELRSLTFLCSKLITLCTEAGRWSPFAVRLAIWLNFSNAITRPFLLITFANTECSFLPQRIAGTVIVQNFRVKRMCFVRLLLHVEKNLKSWPFAFIVFCEGWKRGKCNKHGKHGANL